MRRLRFAAVSLSILAGLVSACSSPEPASAVKDQPAVPKPPTAEERVKYYQDCWAAFNQKKWDELKTCYASNAVSQDASGKTMNGSDAIVADGRNFAMSNPDVKGDGQLILVNGNHIAGVYLITGTNSGPGKSPDGKDMPPTNKKFGLLMGHSIDLGPADLKAVKEFASLDGATFANQIGLSKMPGR